MMTRSHSNQTNCTEYFSLQTLCWCMHIKQETRMLSQALNHAMLHSRNQLEEGINHQELIFYLAVQLNCTLRQ